MAWASPTGNPPLGVGTSPAAVRRSRCASFWPLNKSSCVAVMMRVRACGKAPMLLLKQQLGPMAGSGCDRFPVKNARALTSSSSGSCSAKADDYLARVTKFMRDHVAPAEDEVTRHANGPERWTVPTVIEDLKKRARDQGLWNLWVPHEMDPDGKLGAGLSNEEYARLAEVMGRIPFASEAFNCSAPDTGNMEVLLKYGSDEQKVRWLQPLLDGEIRSCFAMTEPSVASSDATNIQASIKLDGDSYVVNGHKWWTSGAMDPRCKVCIVMGKTDTSAETHKQQSMVIVPMPSPGMQVVRPLTVFGYDDAPHGHAEVLFEDVRVPAGNLILGEGRGFEIAQGRLGPGRIHHCMRVIGICERALALHCQRAMSRVAFKSALSDKGVVRREIAESRIAIDQARLLVMHAARCIDEGGAKSARREIAMIKAVVPLMAQQVVDRAMQVHGAAGFSGDTPLAYLWSHARWLRMADGPDDVHFETVAKMELKGQTKYPSSF